MNTPPLPYHPINKIRIVTAASLFDGHDASINIFRRIMQSSGAEVIHLGHDRSVNEVVNCAIQEDANGIAITSYQGGHIEYFKYMLDLLKERGCGHIRIFGGGGGTILPSEIKELQDYGITRIYHPDDGRTMGLQGMINDMLQQCDYPTGFNLNGEVKKIGTKNHYALARLISAAENNHDEYQKFSAEILEASKNKLTPVLGITGTGGSGKSSLVDELVRRFLVDFKDKTMAIISVDPSKRKTGGALLGDRIRMNAINNDRVYMRSLATRQSNLALSKYVREAIDIVKAAGFDLIILETSGIGQSDTEITEHSDMSLYVMTPEYGAATQLEKIDMLDFADIIALNKFDKREAIELFMNDPETEGIVMIGEIGGGLEAEAARWIKANGNKKPVVGFIAGQTAPAGRRMGHAGAIIGGAEDTAAAKMKIMEECGITVVATPADIGITMAAVLKKAMA